MVTSPEVGAGTARSLAALSQPWWRREVLVKLDRLRRPPLECHDRGGTADQGAGGSGAGYTGAVKRSWNTIVFVTRSYEIPSTAAALLQLARLKAGLSQRELADRAGVPATMVSAYERDKRQPTVETLLRLLHAAGFDLRMRLEPYDPHDDVLAALEEARTPRERARRDRQIDAWRQATPA